MTPAEQLAAARQNVVGPYLPTKPGWLAVWEGPRTRICGRCGSPDIRRHCSYCGDSTFDHTCNDGCKKCGGADVPALDVHRPEVRDHLVRLGCPDWARDVPAAVWAWGMWGHPPGVLLEWHQTASGRVWHRAGLAATQTTISVSADGWRVLSIVDESGPETGDLGRACADLAALNAGCILRVEGGWLVPLLGGGIGFFEEVNRDE